MKTTFEALTTISDPTPEQWKEAFDSYMSDSRVDARDQSYGSFLKDIDVIAPKDWMERTKGSREMGKDALDQNIRPPKPQKSDALRRIEAQLRATEQQTTYRPTNKLKL